MLANLKPFLIVLAIGLLGVSVRLLLDPDTEPSLFGITAYFERLVDDCQETNPSWDRDICEKIAAETSGSA